MSKLCEEGEETFGLCRQLGKDFLGVEPSADGKRESRPTNRARLKGTERESE